VLGSADAIAELVELARAAPAAAGPPLEAQLALQDARLAVLRREGEPAYDVAVTAFRDVGAVFWVATTQLEQAEWLIAQGRAAEVEALVAEARATFERLRVPPLLERLAAVEAAAGPSKVASPT
jgi:hypothetical protein